MNRLCTGVKIIFTFLTLLIFTFLLTQGCKENQIDDEDFAEYRQSLLKERAEKDSSFQFDPYSPFNRDTTITFKPLKYYEPDPEFIFKSGINYNSVTDTVFVLGTKSEIRPVVVLGYIELNYRGEIYKVNVYRGFSRTGEPYHSIWFTDRTTGKETYGVGRYIDIELNADKDFIYEIDFNRAYNPYCAYSSLYTCPIPREEDYIDISIEAGEKNFH